MLEKFEFFERVQRLRWIDRCSNTPHIKPYSVAQHSFYVSLYAMVFAHLENDRLEEERYNLELVLQKALVHDLEECETGDILYPLHDENPEFKERLNYIRDQCIEHKIFEELPLLVREKFKQAWRSAKDDSPEGQLVACMDKFEILMYAFSEYSLGNKSLYSIAGNAIRIIERDFRIPSVLEIVHCIKAIIWGVSGSSSSSS